MKDLAVLIPVYNDSSPLLRTLDSIIEDQNDFTVFVVDDGSGEPIEIDAGSYPFSIRLIRLDENRGIVGALNAGLEAIREAGFSYVARLDAADLNRKGRFALQYSHLEFRPDLSMIGSNVVFRAEDSDEPLFTTNLPLSSRATRRWMMFRNSFIHPSVMFRIEVLEKTGLYDSSYAHIEDYVLFSRIVQHFEAENLATPLVDCFIREGGISRLHSHRQLVSGLRFKFHNPSPFDILWYAYIAKRTSYLILPHSFRHRLKEVLGFTKRPAPQSAC